MDQETPSGEKEVEMVERKGQRGIEKLLKQPTRYSEDNKRRDIRGDPSWVSQCESRERERHKYISSLKRV
jgi:hypothetical protein